MTGQVRMWVGDRGEKGLQEDDNGDDGEEEEDEEEGNSIASRLRFNTHSLFVYYNHNQPLELSFVADFQWSPGCFLSRNLRPDRLRCVCVYALVSLRLLLPMTTLLVLSSCKCIITRDNDELSKTISFFLSFYLSNRRTVYDQRRKVVADANGHKQPATPGDRWRCSRLACFCCRLLSLESPSCWAEAPLNCIKTTTKAATSTLRATKIFAQFPGAIKLNKLGLWFTNRSRARQAKGFNHVACVPFTHLLCCY